MNPCWYVLAKKRAKHSFLKMRRQCSRTKYAIHKKSVQAGKSDMNKDIIIRIIQNINSGEISVKDFAKIVQGDAAVVGKILAGMEITGRNGILSFGNGDRLKCALAALKDGASMEQISEVLTWRDFEGLAAEVLSEAGYETARNVMLKSPRAEIDVIGINGDTAILIDCKHWKKDVTRIQAERQAARAKRYASANLQYIVVPAIVSLHQSAIFLDKMPVVPIWQFASFVNEVHGYIDTLRQAK